MHRNFLHFWWLAEKNKQKQHIKKNGKTGENFESVHKVSMAFVAKKIVLLIYDYYQRVAIKFAIYELHFSRR